MGRDEQAAARLGTHFGLEGIVVHAKCGLNLRLRGAIELVITDLQMWKEIQDDIEREPLAQTQISKWISWTLNLTKSSGPR